MNWIKIEEGGEMPTCECFLYFGNKSFDYGFFYENDAVWCKSDREGEQYLIQPTHYAIPTPPNE